MKIKKLDDKKIEIDLPREELRWFSQALNECCNGLRIKDFVATIGAGDAELERMLDQVGEMYQAPIGHESKLGVAKISEENFRMTLKPSDARIFVNCMKETLAQLGDWEYQTRMGAKAEQIKTVIASLEAALR